LDDFGPLIGLHGFAVYCALSRHAYAGDEEANVSLTKLCTHLKMGRAKLLETLGELRDVGLIAIERGDRKTTNTYTLLEVPKGSSEQNQGSSEQNQGGSSEQNPYKTRENKTTKRAFSGKNRDSGRQQESERRVEQIRSVFGPDAV
jgi:DNA-binding transcriptional MocR family regulator